MCRLLLRFRPRRKHYHIVSEGRKLPKASQLGQNVHRSDFICFVVPFRSPSRVACDLCWVIFCLIHDYASIRQQNEVVRQDLLSARTVWHQRGKVRAGAAYRSCCSCPQRAFAPIHRGPPGFRLREIPFRRRDSNGRQSRRSWGAGLVPSLVGRPIAGCVLP
jgi:hypothetical protein